MSGCSFNTQHLQQLLEFGDHMQSISLSGNTFVDDDMDLDLEIQFPNLRYLNLEGLNIGDRRTEYLVDYLIQTRTIEHMR